MKKNFKIIFFLFISFIGLINAQHKTLVLDIPYESSKLEEKHSTSITNSETHQTLLFIEDYKKFHTYLLDTNLNIQDSLMIPEISKKFKVLKGYTIDNNVYRVLLSNEKSTKFLSVTIDYDNKKWNAKPLELKLKNESIIQSISHNNLLYLITVTKRTSNVNFYKFEKDLSYTKFTKDFKNLEYKSPSGFPYTAFEIFRKGSPPFKTIIDIPKIEGDLPQSLETTSKPTKLYIEKDKFIFSFDGNRYYTHLFFIDANTLDVTEKKIGKPNIETTGIIKHNSFVMDGNIFLLSTTSKEFKFSIKNIETTNSLKEIHLFKKDSILFKNGSVYYEGIDFFGSKREHETEKTSKFLRKITSSKVGVSIYKQNGFHKISIGGIKEVKSSGGGMMMAMPGMAMPGVSIGGGVSVGLSFNPTYMAYNSYSNTKSTYIECLFDDNFTHQKMKIPDNAFDKIKNFEEEITDRTKNTESKPKTTNNRKPRSNNVDHFSAINLKNIFKINNKFYLGFLAKSETQNHRTFNLYEFKD